MPEDPIAGMLETPDGARIRFGRWKAKLHPVKGTVILLHGRAEYIEKMFETVADLQTRGFEVVTFDWRGQGGSSRMLGDPRRGYIDSFDQYIIDLDTIIKEIVLPDCPGPYYILGHSTGSLVALLAAPDFGNRIRRMVLCSPLLALGTLGLSQSTLKVLTGVFSTIGLGEIYVSGGAKAQENRAFVGNNLTSDPDRFDRSRKFANSNPQLAVGGPTATWLYAAIMAMERMEDPEHYGQITIPTLLISAGSDKVVNLQAIEELGRRMRSGSSLTINGARHELMQERDIFREQMLSAFETFIPGTELAGH
jgi:lysophospholipase